MRRFRYCKESLFLVAVGTYAVNRWMIKPGVPQENWFIHGYLNDLLVIPCALPPLLFVYRILGLRKSDGPPTKFEVLLHLGIWSFIFEVVGPLLNVLLPNAVADGRDIVCYATGALAALLLWNSPWYKGGGA